MPVLPREQAEFIIAEHAAGKSARAIARTTRHAPQTVRDYVNGRRAPGVAAGRPDTFASFAGYCRQRLADDPHLRGTTLLAEISVLGFPGTRPSFYRALLRHQIQPHPCPDCHVARISGYTRPLSVWQPQPSPLPRRAAPVPGETLTSFLGRLAAVNLTSTGDLLAILPPWYRVKARWHDDRWQHASIVPFADDAAARLAILSRSAPAVITHALPAFGLDAGEPVRAITACRLCTAARGIKHPVPVHLPAWQQVCLRHGIWLPARGAPQLSVSSCPDILAAERRARGLANRYTTGQLIHAKVRAAADRTEPGQACDQRATALTDANLSQVSEPGRRELLLAADYPCPVAIDVTQSDRADLQCVRNSEIAAAGRGLTESGADPGLLEPCRTSSRR